MMPKDVRELKIVLSAMNLTCRKRSLFTKRNDPTGYEEPEEAARRIVNTLEYQFNFPYLQDDVVIRYEDQCYEIILEEVHLCAMQKLL